MNNQDNNKTVQLHSYINTSLAAALDDLAAKEGISKSKIVKIALVNLINECSNNPEYLKTQLDKILVL